MSPQKCEIGAPYGAAEDPLATSTASAVSGLIAFFQKSVSEIIRYRAFRAAEKELYALDDRMLADIGIDRSEITSTLINAANERRNGWHH